MEEEGIGCVGLSYGEMVWPDKKDQQSNLPETTDPRMLSG